MIAHKWHNSRAVLDTNDLSDIYQRFDMTNKKTKIKTKTKTDTMHRPGPISAAV